MYVYMYASMYQVVMIMSMNNKNCVCVFVCLHKLQIRVFWLLTANAEFSKSHSGILPVNRFQKVRQMAYVA